MELNGFVLVAFALLAVVAAIGFAFVFRRDRKTLVGHALADGDDVIGTVRGAAKAHRCAGCGKPCRDFEERRSGTYCLTERTH